MANTIILLETNLKLWKEQEKRAESETQVVKSHGNRDLRVLVRVSPPMGFSPPGAGILRGPSSFSPSPISVQTSRLLARGALNRRPALGEENVVGGEIRSGHRKT